MIFTRAHWRSVPGSRRSACLRTEVSRAEAAASATAEAASARAASRAPAAAAHATVGRRARQPTVAIYESVLRTT